MEDVMDAARPSSKPLILVLRDQSDNRTAKQASRQSGAEPFPAPKDGADRQKPDPKDTERKMETFGATGMAAALFSIPH